ncbi:MAG: hypothetical protein J7K85_04850 [Anaerolineaceae bacterium]|nr:hypothetical protein [Anaerolineaceae bacterium]
MQEFFNGEMISLLAVFVSLMATLVLILIGRRSLMDSKEARLSVLDEMIAERKSRLGDKGELEAKVETLNKKRDELQAITQAMQNDLDPLREKHSKALLDYEEAKVKLRSLRDYWGKMQDKVELFEKRIKQLSELEEEISKLTAQKDALQLDVDQLPKVKEELEKMRGELDKILQKMKGLQGKVEAAESKKAELEAGLTDVEEKISQKTEALNAIEEQIAEKEVEQQKKDQELHDVNVNLDARKNELRTIGQIPEEAFKSLRTSWLDAVREPNGVTNEMDALSQLDQLVQNCGFEISTRLQYAFHTSLKTSDISCLTVMAGVSGTGKSAFPKIYAQAMGIHFLPLAVEPRWDSPQDLFGFLNYMENRYEATTLGRALVQFNNSPHSDQHASMKDQILMVLLDEMNLARIEYYFSEFLSKLEMRRNANLNVVEDYNNISLEIFAGYPAEGDKPGCSAIRLFAGQNVLFVGTMNEDESTQSLSDKVIDRANVIHFGRPEKLRNRAQQIPTHTMVPISYATWSRWICEPDGNTIANLQQAESMINDINAVLGELGRPFGWRTYKAVLTYLANYPDKEKGNRMRPLADQIAMRVMPKLRGVDLNEHAEVFNRLQALIQRVDDHVLLTAFDEAKNSSMGFFNWRGINWDS